MGAFFGAYIPQYNLLLKRYLSKLPHINAECKLSAEEEDQLALLFGIKGDDIKKGEHPSPNRKAALDAKRVRDSEGGGDPQVTLQGGKPKVRNNLLTTY